MTDEPTDKPKRKSARKPTNEVQRRMPMVNKGRGSGGYEVGRKPRCDCGIHVASADVQLEAYELMKTKSSLFVRQWLADVHKVKTSPIGLLRFFKRWEHERSLAELRDRTARTVAHVMAENMIDTTDKALVQRIESFLMGTALSESDPSAYIALQKLELDRMKVQLEREKVELNKRKLDQLEQLEGIAKNEKYTTEQKGELLNKVLA